MRQPLAVAGLLWLALAAVQPARTQPVSVDERIAALEAQIAAIELEIQRLREGVQPEPAPTKTPFERILEQQCPQQLLNRRFFAICYHPQWRTAVWVGYNLNADNLEGSQARTDDFREDPELEVLLRSTLKDYRGSGFDRGHMGPAAAFRRSREAMSTTFLLSNMAPQTGNLNRQIWRILEGQVRDVASAGGETWVFTGNLFLDDNGNPREPDEFIGENDEDRVAVPTHCFKAILSKRPSGEMEAYGFLLPNQRRRILGRPADFQRTVRAIEEASGIDFFAYLPDEQEDEIETQVFPWPVQ